MTDSNRRMTHAALVAALIASPVFAASDSAAIEQQLNALQQALARQQEQLAQQQHEIERLRQQIAASSSGGADIEQIADDVQQAKLAAQDAPRAAMTSARPTISSADGRSSIALRSVVQLDAANHAEDADRGASDFRRGSVGAAANRETAAARVLALKALDLRRQLVHQHQREADAQLAARRRGSTEPCRRRQPSALRTDTGDAAARRADRPGPRHLRVADAV